MRCCPGSDRRLTLTRRPPHRSTHDAPVFRPVPNEQSSPLDGALLVRGRFSCLNKQSSPFDGDLFVRTGLKTGAPPDEQGEAAASSLRSNTSTLVASFTTQADVTARTASAKALAVAS
jgi:hypothetical protein